MNRSRFVWLIIICVLILDQTLKIWVKTNMSLGENISLFGTDWAYLNFVENPGMAFGIELGGKSGKLILSLFRVIVISILLFFIYKLIELKASYGFLACISLIAAGAIGNVIDSAFYGVLFSASAYHSEVATFMPPEGGYAGFMFGKVVDMFYFPLYKGILPDFVPLRGGTYFEFFRPVFNLADTSISTGVISILIFYKREFNNSSKPLEKKVKKNTEEE